MLFVLDFLWIFFFFFLVSKSIGDVMLFMSLYNG